MPKNLGPDLFRRAAGYVDRIIKGIPAGGLPIQLPTKFEFVLKPQRSSPVYQFPLPYSPVPTK
jgi:hypothetical protein